MISKLKQLYQKEKFKIKMKKYNKFIIMDTSTVLLNSFSVDIRMPDRRNDKCIKIGANSLLGGNLVFEKETGSISIGNRTYIGGGTNIISINNVEIGDDVTIAWGCTIYDHNSHSIYWSERSNDTLQCIDDYKKTGNFIKNKEWNNVKTAPIKICNKAWIGFDCVILKGVTIGEGAVVGARSVVTKDVPPYTVVAGNPAKVVKTLKKEK
ncbi:acyltransferase [Clostridium sp. HBUAS56017]|uniref:acyltransferase n=1 Tax=Clostridium sp. HBUAS56017 TaxID=2571128 RepID=UPI002430F9BF|nr:acyltransferase [Clostridium sp. HBUAS56017]